MPENESWKDIARRKQEQRDAAIPASWRLQSKPGANRVKVLAVPRECGILTKEEIAITEDYDACGLLDELASGRLKSIDVTTAICKRAAIAHQLVSLTLSFYITPLLSLVL